MDQDVTVVRIYLHESEHGRRTTLLREVLDLLHERQRVRGVTVFRGIVGFGSTGEVHAADMLRLNADLPLVIEFFDEPRAAAAAMALLHDIVPAGHMIHWTASFSVLAADQNPSG